MSAAETYTVVRTSTLLRALKRHKIGGPKSHTVAARLATLLRGQAGRVVPYGELIDALYGDDPDGGPLYASNVLRVLASRLRHKGVPIRTCWGHGLYWPRDEPAH